MKFQAKVGVALVVALALASCRKGDDISRQRSEPVKETKAKPDYAMNPGGNIAYEDDRPLVFATQNPVPWAMPLTADPATVAAFSLTTSAVLLPEGPTAAQVTRDLYYSALGEGANFNTVKTLLERYAAFRGYTDFNVFLTEYKMKWRYPSFVLANPTSDPLKNMLLATNVFSMGTAVGTGEQVLAPNCSACHANVFAHTRNDGTVRQLSVSTWDPSQHARSSIPLTGIEGLQTLQQFITAGPQSGDPDRLKAAYVLVNQAMEEMNSPTCDGVAPKDGSQPHWKCNQAYVAALADAMTSQKFMDLSYLMALSIGALATQRGGNINTIGGGAGAAELGCQTTSLGGQTWFTDDDRCLDGLTKPYRKSYFSWGGVRSAITDVILSKDPLKIDLRSQRNPILFSIFNSPSSPLAANNISAAFAASYAQGPLNGVESNRQWARYLMAATRYRLPALDHAGVSYASLAKGGFGDTPAEWTRFINAIPRYPFNDVKARSETYFSDYFQAIDVTPTLPYVALATINYSDLVAGVALYNDRCGACHAPLLPANGIAFNAFQYLRPDQYAIPTSYITNGTGLARDVINAITTTNTSDMLPSILTSAMTDSSGARWNAGGVVTSTSNRVGPFGYTRGEPYAGRKDALAFLTAGGGTAPADLAIVPRERNSMGLYTALATAPIADKAALDAIWGRSLTTGSVRHPTFAPVTGAQADLFAKLLVTYFADRAILVPQQGIYRLLPPVRTPIGPAFE